MTPADAVSVMAEQIPAPAQDGLSLMTGWLPGVIEGATLALLSIAVARSSPRWWLVWVPVSAAFGIGLALVVRWYIFAHGLTTNRVPMRLWVWIALFGASAIVLLAGWHGPQRNSWNRAASLVAVPLCVLCALLAANRWTGYLPTVQIAWAQATSRPVHDEISAEALAARQHLRDTAPPGAVVRVNVPNATSQFRHRPELVYLPPAWFASDPPPQLPVVVMVGAAFNSPEDWPRTGSAVATADRFAELGKSPPILVFPDIGGSFENDTECVDGPRGNVSTHLTEEVVPYVTARFGTRPPGDGWGVVGFSMGGTCAIHLAVRHPEIFNAFVDIGGDVAPNLGSKEQTNKVLFGGDTAARDEFDPRQAMARHGPYTGVSGWFSAIGLPGDGLPTAAQGCNVDGGADDQARAASILCAAARAVDIDAMVVPTEGDHNWPTAARVFADALPWLTEHLGTPVARQAAPDPGQQTQNPPIP